MDNTALKRGVEYSDWLIWKVYASEQRTAIFVFKGKAKDSRSEVQIVEGPCKKILCSLSRVTTSDMEFKRGIWTAAGGFM